MPLVRSISGLRATLGDELTPELVSLYSMAFSAILPDGKIVIGRDGRRSGEWIELSAIAALRACGSWLKPDSVMRSRVPFATSVSSNVTSVMGSCE